MSEFNKGKCYCSAWDTNPQAFEKQGIPHGYCGFCDVCGRPGHCRAHPGAPAVTSSLCDEHWQAASQSSWIRITVSILLSIAVMSVFVLTVALLINLFRR